MTESTLPSFYDASEFPALVFQSDKRYTPPVRKVWRTLSVGKDRQAIEEARRLADCEEATAEDRAGLFNGMAYARLRLGQAENALRLATASQQEVPGQWMAVRIKIECRLRQRQWAAAYELLSATPARLQDAPLPRWDQPLPPDQVEYNLAGWSWSMARWKRVRKHLSRRYPGGLETMPLPALEAWFRAALFRDLPEDAEPAARVMLRHVGRETADRLIQMLFRRGWVQQATSLYEVAYGQWPDDPLFRRRLIGLYLRTGAVDNARRLSRLGPMSLAPDTP